jgi:hypothetical protein
VIGEKSFIPTYRFMRGEKKSFTYEVVLKRVFSKKTTHEIVGEGVSHRP